MILDAHQGVGHELPRYGICIVGAGAAGISLALELEGSGVRVCLLEAGGAVYQPATQRLFEGEVIAEQYPSLRDSRVGAFGGTTNVWAGWCRPLEALDFEPRDWCGGAGWPFGLDELLPYYARAQETCGLEAFEYDAERWAGVLGSRKLLAGDATFTNQIFQIRAQNFGLRYRERLERSKTVDVVLHAPVTTLSLAGARCAAAQVRTLEGHETTIAADHFVLAAGGVENARLLLLSGATPAEAPGNAHGLVGRYFTDHAFVDPGALVLRERDPLHFYRPWPVAPGRNATVVRGFLSPCREVVERDRLMHGAFFVHPRYEAHRVFDSEEVKAFLQVWEKRKQRAVPGAAWPLIRQAARSPHRLVVAALRKLAIGHGPARRWRMRAVFETEFRPENRVTLSDATDRLGRRLGRLEWRLGEADIEGMRRLTGLFDQAVRRAGLGHFERAFPDEPSAWRHAAEGGKHHMGTTRMHGAPERGVVDPNSRVHGTANLFVAGSSVFPSGGYANPTLTIVALALRLGDHLKRVVSG